MSLVIDASALVDVLLGAGRAAEISRALEPVAVVHAPELHETEVLSALRRHERRGELDVPRAEQAVRDLGDFPLIAHGHGPLRARVWSLRGALTAYDATYVALAEALGMPLLTVDARLARAAEPLVPLALVDPGAHRRDHGLRSSAA